MKLLVQFAIQIFFSQFVFGQCPELVGAMVNACGAQEGINEIVLFNSGSTAATVDSFNVRYGTANNPPKSNIMPGKCATTPSGGASITGCTVISVTSPSTTIPANSLVAFIPSTFNNNYDLSSICGGSTIYVVYINIVAGSGCNTTGVTNWLANGTLANNPSGPRYLQVTGPDGCDTINSPVSDYSYGWSSNTDGNYVSWVNGSQVYSNSGCNAPLHMELLDFNVKNIGQTNLLTWSTASEIDNIKFEIERSDDGFLFKNIGTLAGKINSTTIENYSFTDDNPSFGLNYYRLKSMDKSGKEEFSKIISVNQVSKAISLRPTSATSIIELEIQKYETPSINIINSSGLLVRKNIVCSMGKNRINIEELPSGLYFIQIKSADTQIAIEKFVKN